MVSDSVYGSNIIVEVEDMHAQGWAIDAMSLHQFKGKIPSDRHTPIVTDVAIDGIYAVRAPLCASPLCLPAADTNPRVRRAACRTTT